MENLQSFYILRDALYNKNEYNAFYTMWMWAKQLINYIISVFFYEKMKYTWLMMKWDIQGISKGSNKLI